MIRVLAITMFVLLVGCATFPDFQVEPEMLRDRVTVVWHRTTPEQMARISEMFLPREEQAVGIHLAGLALPGPGDECHVYAPDVARDPSRELRTFGHEVLHCFLGGYHTPEWVVYEYGITWHGISHPVISRYYLSVAEAAMDGRPLPEPPSLPKQTAASSGCGE